MDLRQKKTLRAISQATFDDHYSKVAVGDTVVVRANYLVMTNRIGIVMKHSELVSVEK